MEKLRGLLSKARTYIFGRSSYRPELADVPVFFEGIGVTVLLAYFFYRNTLAIIPMLPVSCVYMRGRFIERDNRKKDRLRMAFRDLIQTVSTNLNAGYSVENAFRASVPDLIMLHGKKSGIVKELEGICRGMDNNIPFTEMLAAFGVRSGVEEIREFAEIFALAKKSGGKLNEIIASSVRNISGRLEVEEDIRVLLSSKKYEQKIMNIVPFFILAYIGVSSPGYFNILYGNLLGTAVMTGCLGAYIGAYALSEKIVNIRL